MSRLLFTGSLIILCLQMANVQADIPAQTSSEVRKIIRATQNSPYCGVYCMYACLKMFNKDVELADLLEPRYVGSPSGSTQKELIRLAHDHGVNAKAMEGLTLEALRHSSIPIILHVKDHRRGKKYRHWVLYLGMENGKARILDPTSGVALAPMSRLLARWGGMGILISEHPQSSLSSTWVVWRNLLGVSLLFVVAVWCVRLLLERMRGRISPKIGRKTSLLFQCAGLVVFSILLGIGFHLINGSGFLRNPLAVRDVQRRYHSTFLPKLTTEDVKKLLDSKNAVVVDARMQRDFQSGHLPGAISLPVNASDAEREQIMSDLPCSKQVVIYCQSSGCGYAQEVADVLSDYGYDRISLYPGGWLEWEKNLNNLSK